jgi:hypothetical protein
MLQTELNVRNFHGANFLRLATVALLLVVCFPIPSRAQQQRQKTFSSAEAASEALFTAAQNGDENAMIQILGPDGKQIVSSGDDIEDEHTRTNFAQKYQEMHRLLPEPDGTTTLYVGAENWPTPIPLVNKGNLWYFDTDAAKNEILLRRVGQNEMSAIRVCQELVAAEKEYFSKEHNEFAQKFVSDEGKHNGLYWLADQDQFESPIGPLLANAGAEGGLAKNLNSGPVPFHGYYFRILTRQGQNAPGGAANFIVVGKMTGGFAFLAYPAEYRSSGVMTFIVGKDGVVYEKDLGQNTVARAKAIKDYNPNSTWQKSEEQPQESADTHEIR